MKLVGNLPQRERAIIHTLAEEAKTIGDVE